jgi:hypothetical protein
LHVAAISLPYANTRCYELKATSVAMLWPSVPIFTNGKGGTLSVSRQTNKAVSYGVVAGAESEVGAAGGLIASVLPA